VNRACLHQVLANFDSLNASVTSERSCLLSFVGDSVPQMIHMHSCIVGVVDI
jgi:hypothetical protein